MVNSPFKFLNPYEAKDKNIFFGRDSERDALINLIHSSNLMIVYGLSGTGKTSLLRSGLAQKFELTDWFPITTIRKKDGLMSSLQAEIQKFLPENQKEVTENEEITAILQRIYSYYLRPIYLIFDQFEEIFTVESSLTEGFESINKELKAENGHFFEEVKKILAGSIPCKIIFCIREEYLGQLYPYEEDFPHLFDHRLRVEPMTRSDLVEVCEKTTKSFNIETEVPISKIVDKLLEGNAEKQLTYLQVYLDSLWQAAYQEKYTENWYGKILDVTISQKIFDEVGDVSKVLKKYFYQQRSIIKSDIGATLTDEQWREFEKDILDNFITSEGTKQPVLYVEKNEEYILKNIKFEKYDAAFVTNYINALIKARIIRKEPTFFELSHDSLAQIIFDNRSVEDILVRNIEQNISGSFQLFKNNDGGLLPIEIINIYDRFSQKITLSEEIKEYVEKSRKEYQDGIAELEAKNADLNKASLEIRQKNTELEKTNEELIKSKKKVLYYIASAILLSLFAGTIYYIFSGKLSSVSNEKKILEANKRNLKELFKQRFNVIDTTDIIQKLSKKRDTLIGQGDISEATVLYIGIKLFKNDTAVSKAKKNQILLPDFYQVKNRADNFYNVGDYENAVKNYIMIKNLLTRYANEKNVPLDTNVISEKIFAYQSSKSIWIEWKKKNDAERDSAKTYNIELPKGTLNMLPLEIVRKYEYINRVQLNDNKFSTFPVNLFSLPNLETIYLNDNAISQIPTEINHLKNLKVLSLNNNKFLELPKSVCRLENLINLNLAGNRITHLPKEISQMKNLSILTLSNNHFEVFPNEIFLLAHLNEIYLNECGIIKLPTDFVNSLKKSNIKSIYLKKNAAPLLVKEEVYNAQGERIRIIH